MAVATAWGGSCSSCTRVGGLARAFFYFASLLPAPCSGHVVVATAPTYWRDWLGGGALLGCCHCVGRCRHQGGRARSSTWVGGAVATALGGASTGTRGECALKCNSRPPPESRRTSTPSHRVHAAVAIAPAPCSFGSSRTTAADGYVGRSLLGRFHTLR